MLAEVGVPVVHAAAVTAVAIESLPVLGVGVCAAKKAACVLRELALGDGGTAAPAPYTLPDAGAAGVMGEKIECEEAHIGLVGVVPFAAHWLPISCPMGARMESCGPPVAAERTICGTSAGSSVGCSPT